MHHQEHLQAPSRSITQPAKLILQKIWSSKELPPVIKTFAWRLIRRALATGKRAARYSSHNDELCLVCGAVEDDAHLFFHCDLPRAVGFTANPSLITNLLPHESDGVQIILQFVLPSNIPASHFNKIFYILWYLWKARNDNRFNRKTWSPMQVHYAVQAHMSAHAMATQQPATTGAQPASEQHPVQLSHSSPLRQRQVLSSSQQSTQTPRLITGTLPLHNRLPHHIQCADCGTGIVTG
jgi:hypothetical protein